MPNQYKDCIVLSHVIADGERKEEIIPVTWLMQNPDTYGEIVLNNFILFLTHKEELLKLKTDANIDITISGDIQMLGLHVETKGTCHINEDMPLEVHEGIYIEATKIIIDDVIASPNFITLITPNADDSGIVQNKDIGTKRLLVKSPKFVSNALVDAEFADLSETNLHVGVKGQLYLGRPARPPAFPSSDYHVAWRADLRDAICGDVTINSSNITRERVIQLPQQPAPPVAQIGIMDRLKRTVFNAVAALLKQLKSLFGPLINLFFGANQIAEPEFTLDDPDNGVNPWLDVREAPPTEIVPAAPPQLTWMLKDVKRMFGPIADEQLARINNHAQRLRQV